MDIINLSLNENHLQITSIMIDRLIQRNSIGFDTTTFQLFLIPLATLYAVLFLAVHDVVECVRTEHH